MSIWTQKVKDLQASGMTYAEIGTAINLAPSTVGDLAAGKYKSPRGDAAILLAQLHAEKCAPVKPSKKRAA
jgi:hypothetical protein